MKRLTILLVGLALVGAIAAAVWLWPHGRGQVLRLPGTVEIQEVRLGSKVGGRVAEVFVREGDVVSAGKVLVRFDTPELLAQRDAARQRGTASSSQSAYEAAVANRDRARGRARSAQARWDWMQRGNRPEEIAAAQAELDRAEAHYALLRNGTREEDKALAAAQAAE